MAEEGENNFSDSEISDCESEVSCRSDSSDDSASDSDSLDSNNNSSSSEDEGNHFLDSRQWFKMK